MNWLISPALAGTTPDLPTLTPTASDFLQAVLAMLHLSSPTAAAILSFVGLFGFILTHIWPHVPPPSPTAPTWWKFIYGVLKAITGNYSYLK